MMTYLSQYIVVYSSIVENIGNIYVIIIKLRKVLLNWDLVHLTFTTQTINLP